MSNRNQSKRALMWIRDGVLINRMPINAVAFAYAYFLSSSPAERRSINVTDLVNFAFAKSGISCVEKMTLMLASRQSSAFVEGATRLYNEIASEAGISAKYFDGVLDLLTWLQSQQIESFITSAVEQEVLDTWAAGEQGQLLCGQPKLIAEILGRRPQFCKGQDHFRYVSEWHGQSDPLKQTMANIYYVADAVSEIKQGGEFSNEFSIVPIGFANLIESKHVLTAASIVSLATRQIVAAQEIAFPFLDEELTIDYGKLQLPSQSVLETSLLEAGAKYVVRDFTELRAVLAAVVEK